METARATLDHQEMLQMVKDGWNSDIACETRAEYHNPELPPLGPAMHKRIVGSAGKTADYIRHHGGTKEDIQKALLYMTVCIDAAKHRLDWKKCYVDFDIAGIVKRLREQEVA